MSSRPCGIRRRFAAIAYDTVLVWGTLFFATALVMLFNGGRDIQAGNNLYRGYLLVCAYGYFAWQWLHGGRTLGMRAWRVRLESVNGAPVTWTQTGLRFIGGAISWLLLGGGFIWAMRDAERRGLPDHLSGTRLVVIDPDRPL
jgi:uncharacterized RDD family membrane protein YckC